MLCTVAIRRMPTDQGIHYALRISGRTSLGPSGTGGRETKEFLSAEDLRATLQSLGLNDAVLATAHAVMDGLEDSHHFTLIAEEVQIPFDRLERADIYLFD